MLARVANSRDCLQLSDWWLRGAAGGIWWAAGGSGGLQREGRDWSLVLGSSLGLVLGCLASSAPRVHQNVDNTLFFEENLGPTFQFQGSQVLKSSIDLSI